MFRNCMLSVLVDIGAMLQDALQLTVAVKPVSAVLFNLFHTTEPFIVLRLRAEPQRIRTVTY